MKATINAVRFLWRASAGNRLRPWRSEYLRWRMETYTGKPAGSLRLNDFWTMLISERRQFGHFFVWVGQLNKLAGGKKN